MRMIVPTLRGLSSSIRLSEQRVRPRLLARGLNWNHQLPGEDIVLDSLGDAPSPKWTSAAGDVNEIHVALLRGLPRRRAMPLQNHFGCGVSNLGTLPSRVKIVISG